MTYDPIASGGSPQVAAKSRGRKLAGAIDRLAAAQAVLDEALDSYGYAARECRKRGLGVPEGVQWCGSYECDAPHRINDTLVCPGGKL